MMQEEGIETAAINMQNNPFVQDVQINSTPVMQDNSAVSSTKDTRKLSGMLNLI